MRKKRRAFTFVELILGLSLFSVIALSLYSTFSAGMRLDKRSQSTNRTFREIRWSMGYIARDLRNMVMYDFSNSYPDKIAFVGDPERISFFISTQDGIREVSYQLMQHKGASVHEILIGGRSRKNKKVISRYTENDTPLMSLIRRERSFADMLAGNESPQTQLDILTSKILEGGLRFSFAYKKDTGDSFKIVWRNTWKEPYLPSMVRISITFLKEGLFEDVMMISKDVYIPTGKLGKNPS